MTRKVFPVVISVRGLKSQTCVQQMPFSRINLSIDINQIAFEINQWYIEHRMQMDDKLFKMLLTILGQQPEE